MARTPVPRSVDGMHQQDLEFYVGHNPYGTLAALSAAGTTFTNASTSAPSDSFPGVLALHTGKRSMLSRHHRCADVPATHQRSQQQYQSGTQVRAQRAGAAAGL